jgi:hypothetical protein
MSPQLFSFFSNTHLRFQKYNQHSSPTSGLIHFNLTSLKCMTWALQALRANTAWWSILMVLWWNCAGNSSPTTAPEPSMMNAWNSFAMTQRCISRPLIWSSTSLFSIWLILWMASPHGLLVTQAGPCGLMTHVEVFTRIAATMMDVFPNTSFASTYIPSFADEYGYAIGSNAGVPTNLTEGPSRKKILLTFNRKQRQTTGGKLKI